jgi:hypothetical protein
MIPVIVPDMPEICMAKDRAKYSLVIKLAFVYEHKGCGDGSVDHNWKIDAYLE